MTTSNLRGRNMTKLRMIVLVSIVAAAAIPLQAESRSCGNIQGSTNSDYGRALRMCEDHIVEGFALLARADRNKLKLYVGYRVFKNLLDNREGALGIMQDYVLDWQGIFGKKYVQVEVWYDVHLYEDDYDGYLVAKGYAGIHRIKVIILSV